MRQWMRLEPARDRRMRDRWMLGEMLAGLLPRGLRDEVFEPARRDLEIDRLNERTAAGRWGGVRHGLRLILLFLDCWRIALRDPRLLYHGSGPADEASSGREPAMFLHSMRHAFARMVREPGFAVVVVLVLGLGVGANVAVFAVVEAVLLRPLPYADAARLAIVEHRDVPTGITKEFIAIGDYVDMVERQTAFESIAGYGTYQATVYGEGDPLQVGALVVAPGMFEMLRVRPLLGRTLGAEDSREGAAPTMMLGYALWRDRFGADAAVLGRSVRIGTTTRTVVGIAPAGFRFPPSADTDVILPMPVPIVAPASRRSGWTFAAARLAPAATLESATANLAAIARQMEAEHPEQNAGSTYSAVSLRDALVGDTKAALVLLLGAVGVVLLIGCANVANLQLARALARRREIAVRLALGAGRRQVAGMLLAESFALALVATAAGLLFAHWGVRALVALVPASVQVPGIDDVRLNGAVLAFAVALAVATALVFGALTAFTVRLESARDVLVSAGRSTTGRLARRATSALVVIEVALAVVLLFGAGLILRSFAGLLAVDPGFRYDDVLTAEIQLPPDRYQEPDARIAFYARAFDALRALPGVAAVGAGVVVPLTGNNWTVPFERADRPVAAGERPPDVGWQQASGGFFEALEIPLLAGRLFDGRDRPDSPPVVIISEAVQERFFAGENAVGRQVRLGEETAEIVGVVGDIRRAGLDDSPRADMYFPFERVTGTQITLFVRAAPDARDLPAAVRSALRGIEPGTAILSLTPFEDIVSESVRVTQLVLWLLTVFAGAALLLAAVGIYGVMAYVVRQRTREIGTRMAVGATRGDIVRLVMREGGAVAATGIATGLALALVTTRLLRSVLFGVSPADPATLAGAVGVLAAAMLLACYLPARRASSLDPARTLAQQ